MSKEIKTVCKWCDTEQKTFVHDSGRAEAGKVCGLFSCSACKVKHKIIIGTDFKYTPLLDDSSYDLAVSIKAKHVGMFILSWKNLIIEHPSLTEEVAREIQQKTNKEASLNVKNVQGLLPSSLTNRNCYRVNKSNYN